MYDKVRGAGVDENVELDWAGTENSFGMYRAGYGFASGGLEQCDQWTLVVWLWPNSRNNILPRERLKSQLVWN